MKDNYGKICSENRQLNALFIKQQKDKEKRRARDKALKEARDKARVEEEPHAGCETSVTRGDDKTCNLNSS